MFCSICPSLMSKFSELPITSSMSKPTVLSCNLLESSQVSDAAVSAEERDENNKLNPQAPHNHFREETIRAVSAMSEILGKSGQTFPLLMLRN